MEIKKQPVYEINPNEMGQVKLTQAEREAIITKKGPKAQSEIAMIENEATMNQILAQAKKDDQAKAEAIQAEMADLAFFTKIFGQKTTEKYRSIMQEKFPDFARAVRERSSGKDEASLQDEDFQQRMLRDIAEREEFKQAA